MSRCLPPETVPATSGQLRPPGFPCVLAPAALIFTTRVGAKYAATSSFLRGYRVLWEPGHGEYFGVE
jgi:hypothetical protein